MHAYHLEQIQKHCASPVEKYDTHISIFCGDDVDDVGGMSCRDIPLPKIRAKKYGQVVTPSRLDSRERVLAQGVVAVEAGVELQSLESPLSQIADLAIDVDRIDATRRIDGTNRDEPPGIFAGHLLDSFIARVAGNCDQTSASVRSAGIKLSQQPLFTCIVASAAEPGAVAGYVNE